MNESFTQEFLFNSDINNDFEGFTQDEIDGEVVRDGEGSHSSDEEENYDDPEMPSRYYNPWLTNFMAATGPMDLPDSCSEGEFSCLFINSELTIC